jgi:hypothetical protein
LKQILDSPLHVRSVTVADLIAFVQTILDLIKVFRRFVAEVQDEAVRPVVSLFGGFLRTAIKDRDKIDRFGIQQKRLVVRGVAPFPLLGQIGQLLN